MPSPLPNDDHFARQCPIGYFDTDEQEHEWLTGKAFAPKPSNPNISGQWIEHHEGTWCEQINSARRELRDSKRTVTSRHRYAILVVVRINELGEAHQRSLLVYHTRDEDSGLLSHSEIVGIHLQDTILQQKLADDAQIKSAYLANE